MKEIPSEKLTRADLIAMIHQLRGTLMIVVRSVPDEISMYRNIELLTVPDEVQLAKRILKKTNIK
jgi:hypothetical protein